jgi:N-methylhydantoinase B
MTLSPAIAKSAQRIEEHDPITFAVIKNALDTIVDEMAYNVMRTARSHIVRDVLDYSTTLCDRHGNIVTQARTVALHLGAVPDAIAAVLARYGDDFAPGDVIIMNDPYEGGMHLPDIFMFKPMFFRDRLEGFSVVVAHHCDMGGRVPGSNASDSTEIFQEGLRIPPLKLYRKGEPDETLFRLFEKNVRLPDLVIGDLLSQYATCRMGERQYLKLLERYGPDTMERYVAELLDYAEAMTRRQISTWPNGSYSFTDYIDGDGFSQQAIAIKATITVRDDDILVDFEGSAAQVKGAINCTVSFVKSACYLSVRCMLDHEVPNNSGVFRCVEVRTPEGSILNPRPPAAVAARALTGYRIVDTMFGCLAQIVPDKVMAAGEGGNTVVCIGGYRPETGEPFILVDMINGAWGGRVDQDGIEGVTNPSQNMSNLPVETLEARYPVRIEEFGFVPDSCGAGRFRGGLGLVRTYTLLAEEALLQLRSDRTHHAPYGLFGGEPGAKTVNVLNPHRNGEALSGKVTRSIRTGDRLRHVQAGAGGYGDPLQRDPVLVACDVRNGKISNQFARERHGVVIDSSHSVDVAATETLREGMRGRRKSEVGDRHG